MVIRIKATNKTRIDISFYKNGARLNEVCPIERLPTGKPVRKTLVAGFHRAPCGNNFTPGCHSKCHLKSIVKNTLNVISAQRHIKNSYFVDRTGPKSASTSRIISNIDGTNILIYGSLIKGKLAF